MESRQPTIQEVQEVSLRFSIDTMIKSYTNIVTEMSDREVKLRQDLVSVVNKYNDLLEQFNKLKEEKDASVRPLQQDSKKDKA